MTHGPKPLFEKHSAIAFGLGCPDLDNVYPTHIVEGAEADESLFERYIVGDHDRGEHIAKVKGDRRFLDIPNYAYLAPFVDSPVHAHSAKIGYRRSRRFVYQEYIVGIVIAGLGDVNIHVVAWVLEAEKETVIPVSITASFCGVRIFLHKLSDRGPFDAALQNIDLENETAEGYAFYEGDVIGRTVGWVVFAGSDESEDLITVFLVEFPGGPISHHERVEGGFGSEGLLVLQGISIR